MGQAGAQEKRDRLIDSPASRRSFSQDTALTDDSEVSLVEFANVLLKRWKWVLGLPFVAVLLALGASFIIPERFTATTSFVPESEEGGMDLPGALAGLAAQFGVSVTSGRALSPQFYAEVLRSRTLRDQVLLATFPDPRSVDGDSAVLLDLLRVEGESMTERLEKGREELAEAISIRADSETGIVSVSAETRYATLSAEVVNQLIELLNRFNLETRQSGAQKRREFVEGRIEQAHAELVEAEEALKSFLERNRQYEGSPELRFHFERLQRQVTLKEEVVSTLRRQYEEARIQEVNDTPVFTVVDRAVAPDRRSSPKRGLMMTLALLLGVVFGFVVAFGGEFVERARNVDEREYEEFAARWAGIKADVRSAILRWRRSN